MSNKPDDQEPGWDFLSLLLRPVDAGVRAWQWITGLFGRDTKDQP